MPVARTCGVSSARMEEETVVTVDEGGSVVVSGMSSEGAVSPVVRQLRSGRMAADVLGARSKTDELREGAKLRKKDVELREDTELRQRESELREAAKLRKTDVELREDTELRQ